MEIAKTDGAPPFRVAVIVPCKESHADLADCLRALAPQLRAPDRLGVIVDDGSAAPLATHLATAAVLADPRFVVLRRDRAGGPGSARNTGLDWAAAQGCTLAIFLDADCIPPPDYVETHAALHLEHATAVCIGGAIEGVGAGFWARVDAAMSWFTSIPGAAPRRVRMPLHIPTANMSVKLAALAGAPPLRFVQGLRFAGEDVLFVSALIARGGEVLYAAAPLIEHRDREGFRAVFRHQYRWGLHSYWVRVGFDPSPLRRLLFAAAMAAGAPVYTVYVSFLILREWLAAKPRDWAVAPAVVALTAVKTVSAIQGALFPGSAFHPGAEPQRAAKVTT
jgi:glycosyltransferase involved in cell wall biosynthesis